jgi:phosphodiesterase/alkaline phosphatase D-like protein
MLVATDEATNVLTNSADLPGQIIDLGGGATQYGHYYGKSDNPSANHTTLGVPGSISGFTSQVTGLEAGTKYFFKAYMTDGQETVYGKEKSFTTVTASAPTLTTTAITSITLTGAVSGGNITSDGGATVTARGVCWNNFTAPTTSNNKTTDASGTGTFTSTITGLTAGSTYFVRAYATNSAGTTYGNELTFTTTAASVPTVTTNTIANISYNGAIGGGDVISDGGSPVLARGVCWSASTGPTISNSKTTNGSGTGSFASDISGLSPTTKYYVRAYATNLIGTAYGSEVSFTTSAAPVQLPVITTISPGNITSISATSGGDITSDGGSAVTSRGVCWNGSGSPTLGGNQTVDGSGSGSFASTLAGLAPNTKYYVRAYAVNAVGTAYGNEYNFTTLSASSAAISTTAITSIAQTTASGGGNITSDGGSSITVRGICWSLNQNPTLADSFTDNGPGTGIFSSQLTNLSPGKTYYVRAYATNATGTTYGNQVSFLTASDIPKVTTSAIGTVTSTTAQAGGEVLDNNGSTVTTRGICYNTIGSPTISDNVKSESAAIGTFSLSLTGLTPNTTYYIRAFATNAIGTAYGAQVQFVTPVSSATITTTAVTSITTTTATSGGVISADGGSPVTARGVCWSTSTNPVTGTSTMTDDGTGSGSFTSSLTGLLPNKKYYIRAYAINGFGTAYGDELQFTTLCNSPVVTAKAATNVGFTTATLNGTINADNVSTIPLFQYGTSTSYGTTINSTPYSVDGSANTAISVNITGLTQGTLYHYRIVTSFCGVDVYSSDQTFTTSTPGAPVLSTTTVGSITGTTASSGGTITSDGGAPVTISGICWSTTSNPDVFASKTTDGTTSGTFVSALSGLTPNTLYYVRAYATNSNGIGYGNEVTFTTLQLPTATTNAAAPIATTGATLNGVVNAKGTDTDVTFEYGTSTSYGNSVAAAPAIVTGSSNTAVSSAISGLTENTTYHFRVKAVSLAGTVYGDDQIFTTLCVLPAAAVNAATSVGGTTATLNGVVNAMGFATTVTFEYGPTTSFGSTINASPNSASGNGNTVVTASVTGLTTNTTYYFRIKAVNCAGTIYSSETNFTTLQPPVATTSAATLVAYTTADLNGIVNANNSASTVTFEYGLTTSYGTIISATPGTVTGNSGTAVSASVTGLSVSTTYHYRVKASSAGGSSDGVDLTFTTATPPTVTSISSSAITASSATLNCSVNPNGQSTNVYYEYGLLTSYGTTANGTPLTVTGTSSTAVSATISGLSAGTTYHFRVKTVSLGVTYYSTDYTFITCNPPAATTNAATSITNTTATFNGSVNANGSSTTVTFDWGTDTNYGTSKAATPGTVTGTSGTAVSGAMTGLSPNTTYHYRVKTVNCGGTVFGGDQYFTTLCTAPTATTTSATSVTTTTATLNGTVDAKNFSTSVTFEYGLTTSYGSTGNATPFTVTGSVSTAVSLNLSSLTTNTIYHYRVKAVNSCSQTTYGSDQTFTTLCPSSLTVTHTAGTVAPVTKTLTYGIVQSTLSGASKCWITRNLGADQQATSATDATEPSAGWYWRFNTTQGYKHDGTTRTPGGTWPGAFTENSDWLVANDPCAILLGSGWRIPTFTEYGNLDVNSGWTGYNDAYASSLKLHTGGQLVSGVLSSRGTYGPLHSSTQYDSVDSYWLYVSSSSVHRSWTPKGTYAYPIRCIRD